MKTLLNLTRATAFASCLLFAACGNQTEHARHGHDHEHAHGDHDHEHDHGDEALPKKTPGPNGGRLISSTEPNLEFLVTDDRQILITILDQELKPTAPGDQEFSLVGGDRNAPMQLSFNKEESGFRSNSQLPEGKRFPVVLTIKSSADAEPVIEKFELDLGDCPECSYKEYACICNHTHPHN